MNLRTPPVLVCTLLLFVAGCGRPDSWAPIVLDPEDQAAAEARLYPRFMIMQEFRSELPSPLADEIHELLTGLGAGLAEQPALEVLATAEGGPDAGCLAGGAVFLTQGMLAWIEHRDELAGVLALALSACGQASEIWRHRDRVMLVDLREDNWLMRRYQDFRLNSIAAEYNQLVARGCGAGNSCILQAEQWLEAAEMTAAGLARLKARIAGSLPDAAWFVRFPELEALEGSPVQPDEPPDPLLSDFHDRRSGLVALSDVSRELYGGELREAYRAQIRARQALGTVRDVLMSQVRIDLINLHPENSRRDFQNLEQRYGRHAHSDYWWGMINVQLRNTATGMQQLESSLEVLPQVSTHFQLGVLLEIRQRPEEAVEHYRAVLAAGPVHPRVAAATVRLAALDRN